ncbi:MAG TPA: hypothetical protein VFT22_18575 [Kofleriaceae bacterium]|nr:hypothetical protein [Kofleriaceae bacterium]
MKTTNDFQTIERTSLSFSTGGADGGGDFASRYVNNLKQDGKDWWNREKATANDLQSHNWWGAAKNFGGALLDEVGAVGDAIAPVKALK